MGFLSSLAKIGGIVAAPFSGGASLALTGLGAVGDILGKQQGNAAAGRATQAQVQQGYDRNAVDLYQARQNAEQQQALTDLQRKQFEQGNRSATAKQALIGALLGGGVAPTQVGPSGASGGLFRALAANPDALAAMKTLGSQGSTAQTAPLAFQGGQRIPAPTLTPLPEAGAGTTFLDTLARIAQLGGGLGAVMSKPQVTVPEIPLSAMNRLPGAPVNPFG